MSILLRNSYCLRSSLRFVKKITNKAKISKMFWLENFRVISISKTSRTLTAVRSYSTPEKPKIERDLNEPIKFVGSSAHAWISKRGRAGTVDDEPPPECQMYIVLGSVVAFMAYFFYFREENDVDLEMGKTLYERVPGLEQTQLIINYKYNRENNIDNTKIVERMRELGMKPEEIQL